MKKNYEKFEYYKKKRYISSVKTTYSDTSFHSIVDIGRF